MVARTLPIPAGATRRQDPPLVTEQLDERRAREDLRRQIARLELRLGELFASAFPRGGIEFAIAPAGGPRVLGLRELEEVRDRLAIRLREAQGELVERADVEERNRETLERMIGAPERFHWVRISNEDIGEPGCRHWHSRPRWGLLGMLMGWWRVKLSSGCPLARGGAAAAPRPKKRAPRHLLGARSRWSSLLCSRASFCLPWVSFSPRPSGR